jgi:predicted dehydrogenase
MTNVAIIGTGGIAHAHVEGYARFPGRCRVSALVDLYPEKAEKLKADFKLDARVHASHEAVLADSTIGLVSICLPPYLHAPIAVACMRAGKDVLVEKPMAASLAECDEMIRTAEETGRTLAVVSQNRFRTPIWNLKRTLDSGLAGPVVHAQVDSFWWRGHSYYDLWWRGTWEKEGGGCTLNHAVHHIDMLLWMMGGRPEKVQAAMANLSHDNAEVEDFSTAVLSYPGAVAQVNASLVHHGEDQQLVFHCRDARISAPWKVYASVSKGNGFPDRNPSLEAELETAYKGFTELPHEGHAGQIEDLLTAIETGRAPLVGGREGRTTLEVITAVFRSAAEGRAVALPLERDDPFYTREGIMKHALHFYEKKTSVENFADETITTGSKYK